MSVDPQVARQRVASGSRRKRDLIAAGVEDAVATESFIADHMPGEDPHVVEAARHNLRRSGIPPTAQNVTNFLRVRGWLREQREPRRTA